MPHYPMNYFITIIALPCVWSTSVPMTHAPLTVVFQKNNMAASRRFASIPQITSDGYIPSQMTCTRPDQPLTANTKWSCRGTVSSRVTVQWEGYSSKFDTKHFLKDSFSVHCHSNDFSMYLLTGCVIFVGCLFGLSSSDSDSSDSDSSDSGDSTCYLLGGLGLLGAIFGIGDGDDDWYDCEGDSSIR
jgi:hypothetical protein